jgi:hypothetical protein
LIDNLKIEGRHLCYGCGIYEVGTDGVRMFITDTGHVIPVQGRAIQPEDLMQAYSWGRKDQEEYYSAPDTVPGEDFPL